MAKKLYDLVVQQAVNLEPEFERIIFGTVEQKSKYIQLHKIYYFPFLRPALAGLVSDRRTVDRAYLQSPTLYIKSDLTGLTEHSQDRSRLFTG